MEMNRITKIAIGVIGLVMAVCGVAVYGIWPDSVLIYTILLCVSAVHLLVFFIVYFEAFKEVSQKRSTVRGFNTVLMTFLVASILAIVNFIVVQHDLRFDLSAQASYTLSPQTISVLKGLHDKVKISGFFAQGSPKSDSARDLFENYRHQSKQVEYAFIDPDRQPAVAKQYGITAYDTLVVESKNQSAQITALSEQELTSALIRVGRASKKQIYFVDGHGEHLLENTEQGGYAFLKTSLENQGFSVRTLTLLSEKAVPDDAAVVILGGPETAYALEELAMLRRYLSGGGQMVALLDPMTRNNLDTFLSEWGVVVNREIILDPSSGLGPAVPIVTSYLPHEITREFKMATLYSLAQSVALDPAKAGDIRFDSFVQTGPQSWATKNMTPPISLDRDRDRKGPVVLGGVFSRTSDAKPQGAAEAPSSPRGMRIVVLGDSDFAANEMIRAAGNNDFIQNIMSWLAEEKDLVSIRPKDFPLEALLLSEGQQTGIFYLSVVILPASILIMGLVVYRKRRRL